MSAGWGGGGGKGKEVFKTGRERDLGVLGSNFFFGENGEGKGGGGGGKGGRKVEVKGREVSGGKERGF